MSLRVFACAVFAVLASATPAQAQLETPPTVIPFEDGHTPPIRSGAGEVLASDCGDRTVTSGGWNGGTYLVLGCPFTFLSFSEPQAMVEFYVRMPAGETWVFRACAGEQCSIASQQVVGTGAWVPVVLADPGGNATIRQVVRDTLTSGGPLELDDVAFSTVRQPGTAISGVTHFAAGSPVTYELLSSGVAPSFTCALDGAAAVPCSSPYTATGLAGGAHTLTVTSIDAYGAADPSPAQVQFTVEAADADGDGRPDASDNCPAVANSDQADGDGDGVGNACEQLPAGNVPPVAGVNTIVRQISGEVFVKLPAGTHASASAAWSQRSRRAASSRSRASRRFRSARPWTRARARSPWSRLPTASGAETSAPAASRHVSMPACSRSSRRARSAAPLRANAERRSRSTSIY